MNYEIRKGIAKEIYHIVLMSTSNLLTGQLSNKLNSLVLLINTSDSDSWAVLNYSCWFRNKGCVKVERVFNAFAV
jgi:hypothetical protein